MEGMPRLPMLAPEFKFSTTSLPPEFSTKIKEYILMHYQDDPSKYEAAINEMMSLRAQFGRLIADVETVCQMKRYYAQLTMMKSRFPMEEGDPLKIPFSWLDKAMDMPNSTVYEDVNFELTCIMFNIGAVHAAIAVNEMRSDLDSIKSAFTHFQCAAFPFQHIRDKMNATKYSSVDFEPSILTWYVNVLLAQAQECILEKSLIDHRKNTVIAKIAIYLRDVYMNCCEHLESSGISDIVSSSKYREWLRTCNVKAELYGAVAMVHLGEQADIDKKMGHRLAYYQIASEHVKAAAKFIEKDKRESLRQAVVFATDVVVAKETNAKKENDFIYHERVPKREELGIIEGVAMVKPIGFEPTDRSVAGDDLFAALLPMNVLKSVSMYSEEKAKFKRAILERVEAKDKELDEYLLSLQLEEINLDKSVDELKLPEMLLERSAAFNAQPDAFPDLLDKLQRVGHCAIEADHKLDDLHNRLSAIDSPDLVSDVGFKAIKKELERISEHHMKARTNNAQLQRAIAAHSENLRVLAMPLNELNRRISGPVVKPSETAEGAQLKRMLDKTEEMRAQRRQLLDTLSKDVESDDITAKCLAEKDVDNADLYSKELKKHDEVVRLIDMNLAAQTKILAALTEANASFADCRRQVMELNKSRADQILALTAAYDVYMDVLQKADEGLKFYSTLFSLVRTLDEAMEGVENAYEEEKIAKEKEKQRLEEQKRELRMAREARETMEQFRIQQMDSSSSSLQSSVEYPPNAGGPPPSGGNARLKDYLSYYRSKIAGQLPPSSQQHHVGVMPPCSPAFPPYAQAYSRGTGAAFASSSSMAPNATLTQPLHSGIGLAGGVPPATGATMRNMLPQSMQPQPQQGPSQQPLHYQVPISVQSPNVSRFAPLTPVASLGLQNQQPPVIPPSTSVQSLPPASGGCFAQPAVSNAPAWQQVVGASNLLHSSQNQTSLSCNSVQHSQSMSQMPQNPVQCFQNAPLYTSQTSIPQQPLHLGPQQGNQPQVVQQSQPTATRMHTDNNVSSLPSEQLLPSATIPQQLHSNNTCKMATSFASVTTQKQPTSTYSLSSGIPLQHQQVPFASPSQPLMPQATCMPETSVNPNPSTTATPSNMHLASRSNIASCVSMPTGVCGSVIGPAQQQTSSGQTPTCNQLSAPNAASIISTGSFMPQSHPASASQLQSPFAPSALTSSESGVLSPWHQSLLTNPESLIYGSGRLLNQSPSMLQSHIKNVESSNMAAIPSSTSVIKQPPAVSHTLASTVQNAAPYTPTSLEFDLMSSPLNANLPTPLMPSSQQLQTGSTNSTTTLPDATNNISNNNSQPTSKNEIFAQNVQQPCVSSQSTPSLSTNGDIVQMQATQSSIADNVAACGESTTTEQSSACVAASAAAIAVQPVPRPAAAVAPIMQSSSSTSLAPDVVLGMTSVTSMTYTCTTPAAHKPSQAAASPSGEVPSSNQTNEGNRSLFSDILNPQTFTIGEDEEDPL
uniref:Tyrosine-protein phosphatase non-receptor type 23 n=1 Tax=Ascaris suum TaxID=6253 RepID=F1KR77_ASCSU